MRTNLLAFLLLVCLSLPAQVTDSVLLDAYRREDMTAWKHHIDSLSLLHSFTPSLLTYEYGYCGYLVAEAKKEGHEGLMPEAKRYVQQFKSQITNLKSQMPPGHYEMYRSAVYVYELRLHESFHPMTAMNLAKEAVHIAPEDPLVLAYYGTCLFYAPKAFGNKKDALGWFVKAERQFRSPEWRFCWVREATLMYIQQCNEKLGRTPVAGHQAQCLLVPQGTVPSDGWPAVLLLHDHGARYEKGWEKVIGPRPEPYYSGMAIGDSLAAHGYVVYCMDAPYWGSRRSSLTQRQYSDSLGGAGAWYGQVLAEDKAAVTYLRSLPFVNKKRIAAAGFSYGAYRAWNLAAEDPRVSACLAAHWMTTLAQNRYNDSWLSMCRKGLYPLDQSQITNHQLPITNFAAVAANIAPRPFLLQYGTQDKLFPVSAVDSCVHYIDSVYQMTNSHSPITNHAFQTEKYACGHVFTHKHLQNWLIWLKKHL